MCNSYKFYQNRDCKYFPCHTIKNKDDFNCLFCFCPLYSLGDKCGGDFKYTKDGYKSCEECIKPHLKESSYDFVMDKINMVVDKVKKE